MEEGTSGSAAGGSKGRRFPRPSKRAVVITLAAVLGLAVLGLGGASYAGYRYSQQYDGKILPGAEIAGVDVGGLHEEAAIEAVKQALGAQLDREITLTYGEQTWTVTPRELGAKSNARAAVRDALETSDDASFITLTRMRLFGSELDYSREVAITYPKQGVRGFIQGLASGLDREARDQGIDYSSGWVKFIKPREGLKVVQADSRAALRDALLHGADTVELAVKTTEPEVTDRYDKVLLVRIGENKLYLYQDGKITHEWSVAPGLPEYRTPTGEFEVELKRYMPTWVNPAPDTWGADMPESIPPGIGNPLGLRAINWTAPAIRFHGTSAEYSLGYNASHGCVRMSNADVIELYDLIDVGVPIISIEVAPLRPLYSSTTVVDQETTAVTGEPDETTDEGGDKPGKGNDGEGNG